MDLPPPPLHPAQCLGCDADMRRMCDRLACDPAALERVTLLLNGEESSFTPLQVAIKCHHKSCVLFLIENGADIHQQYGYGGDAMDTSILFNNIDILNLMISKYGMIPSNDRIDYINCEPAAMYMHRAAMSSSPEAIQLLIDNGARTENIEYLRFPVGQRIFPTPVIISIMHEKAKNVKSLLLNGAIIDFETEKTVSLTKENLDFLSLPIRLSLSFGNNIKNKIEIAHVLYNFGVNLLQKSSKGFDALSILENEGYRQAMIQFLEIQQHGMEIMPECSVEHRRLLAAEIRGLMSVPMSLKRQCRLAVKRVMGASYCQDVTRLTHLPLDLRDFLQF